MMMMIHWTRRIELLAYIRCSCFLQT